jgi:phospholipid transport system substrate-binding protein
MRRIIFTLAISLTPAALPVLATPAAAQPAKSGPGTAAVKKANDDIFKLLKAKAPAAQVTAQVRTFLDINELGKQAMVNQWSKLKPAEQTLFLDTLRQLIFANYVNAQQANVNYTINYTGESTNAKGQIVVTTKIQAQRKGRPFTLAVDYVMIKNGANLQAFDVVTDGVSLVENYRAMFDKVIKEKGFTGLIQAMQNKLQQIKSQSAAAPAGGAAPAAPGAAAAPSKS